MFARALPLLILIAGCTCAEAPESAQEPDRVVEIKDGPCDIDDLVLYADVRARSGDEVELTTRERLYLGVVIGNPCTEPITFTTSQVCLTHRFTLTGPDGEARPGGVPCAEAPREWAVAPSDGHTMTFELGNLGTGEYTASVWFTFTDRAATTGFTVLE